MSASNVEVLQQFLAAFESGDLPVISSLLDPQFIDHTAPSGAAAGVDGVLYAVTAYQQAFSDLRFTLEKVVTDTECAVGYGRIRGRHTGSFFGTAASGNRVDFGFIDMYRIEAGRITETWHIEDVAGLMSQIAGPAQEGIPTS